MPRARGFRRGECVAEPFRDRGAAPVGLVADDDHAPHFFELEPGFGQCTRGRRGEATVAGGDVQPVPDLERARTAARHQTERAQERVVGIEQSVLPLLEPFALLRLVADAGALELHVRRLCVGPRHPGPEMVETLADRVGDRGGIADAHPAEVAVVLEIDVLGRREAHASSRTKPCARSTRATRSS